MILSENDYNGITETLYLSKNPAVRQEIEEGLKSGLSECIPENEVEW